MSGPIQNVPAGLLGLLQLKQSGRNPAELLETVAPIYEMRDQYMQSKQLDQIALFGDTCKTANFPTTSPGFKIASVNGLGVVNCTVPQGQTWYVEQMTGIASTPAAADSIRLATAIQGPNLGTQTVFLLTGSDFNDVVTARTRVIVCKSDRPFWAPAGWSFGFWVIDDATAGNWAVTLHMRATPMPL